MNKLASRIKPKNGFANLVHIGLNALLPALIYILVQIEELWPLAISLVFLSKWRMLAVRPRYWAANIRANAIDIMVGVSTVIFMISTFSSKWQVIWALVYVAWLVILKPGTSTIFISLQAAIAQLTSLMALFLISGELPLYVLVISSWLICYLSARHFFTSFDEPYTQLYSHLWAYFAAALVWVLGHWLLFYNVLAQPTLFLTVIGYSLASMYYLDNVDRLSSAWRKQFILIVVAIVAILLIFSDWGDKAI